MCQHTHDVCTHVMRAQRLLLHFRAHASRMHSQVCLLCAEGVYKTFADQPGHCPLANMTGQHSGHTTPSTFDTLRV